jgi:hypothetical protein
MAWNPTNADDATLIISEVNRDDSGTQTGTDQLGTTNAIVVDDFSIETEEDMEALSGIGNAQALGISQGDIEHSFSFTVQGEDAELFQNLVTDDEARAVELQITVGLEEYVTTLTGAYAGTRSLSGSSGDPTEYEVEGIATGRFEGTGADSL